MSDPLRLLLLSGASSVHTVRWANAFAQRPDMEVHLATQHDPIDPLHPAVVLHRLPHRKGAGYLLNGPRLRALVQRMAPHVVNAHYATGYGTLARWAGRAPVVLNVWGSDVYDFPEDGPLRRKLVQGNLRRARLLVSTSEAMADRVQVLCPELPRAEVVPFGVDTELFRPPDARAVRRPVVGTVKVLAPKYGIDTLLRAFASVVRDHGHDAGLRLVGDGPQEGELRSLAAELGLADRVEFVPRVAHGLVPQELARLDVYAALSRSDSESFGVAVIEASACGLPVVVSDAGGLPEVVVDGITGHVVRREDPQAAAAAIAGLLADAGRRARMGRAGRDHVVRHYRWADCVERMAAVLRRAAGR